MSILSEEEIENLKKLQPQKRVLRFIFLIVGSALILTGILFLLLGIDFGILLNGINYSLVIDILIIVLGMILASKYFIAPYYLRENSLIIRKKVELRETVQNSVKFNSLALTRLIAASLLIAIGIVTLLIFGTDIGHEVKYGSAVVLGGPSFFYVTGLPVLGFGIGLLLYFFLSVFKGTFSESANFYFFYELRPSFAWLTEIPKKDIEAIRYQNNHLGPKLSWVIVFMPFIVLQLMTAIPLFAAERAAPGHILSWTFTIISLVEILILFILIMFPQSYYEIATEKMLYEMWFSPYKSKTRPDLMETIGKFLDCGIGGTILKSENEFEKTKHPIFSAVSKKHFQLFDLVFGLFLVISAIIILTQMILFGPWFWWIALIYGTTLLFKAFCYDFSQRDGDAFYYDEKNKIFKFQRWFRNKFHYITAYNIKSITVRKWYRKLDFFDIFGLGGMLIFLTVQQTEGWAIANTIGAIINNAISTIYLLGVFIFIFLYLCLPIDVIEFKMPSITYRINVTLKLKEKSLFDKYKNNLKSFLAEVRTPDMKAAFILRLRIIGALILGSLVFTLVFLVSYII